MTPDPRPARSEAAPAARLTARLALGRLTVPSCYDALGFRMIARAGFPAAFLSGFSVSAARLGMPDAGLLSYGEMAAQARDVAAAAPIPLIVDADTGFGNAQNVQRSVRGFAAAGAACLMLEDQESPKRDFGAPGAVVPRADALRRVKAAVRAREAGRRHPDHRAHRRQERRRPGERPRRGALARDRLRGPWRRSRVRHRAARRAGARARARGRRACRSSSRWTSRGGRRSRRCASTRSASRWRCTAITLVLAAAAAFRDALAAMAAGRPLPPERVATSGEIGDIVGVSDYLAVERDLGRLTGRRLGPAPS